MLFIGCTSTTTAGHSCGKQGFRSNAVATAFTTAKSVRIIIYLNNKAMTYSLL